MKNELNDVNDHIFTSLNFHTLGFKINNGVIFKNYFTNGNGLPNLTLFLLYFIDPLRAKKKLIAVDERPFLTTGYRHAVNQSFNSLQN